MSDIIKILLKAELSAESVQSIKSQLDKVQASTKPIKLEVDTKGSTGIKDITSAFEKLEEVTKKNLMLDLNKLSNRYKNLIQPDDVANMKSMINSLNHTDPKLGHNIDLIKVKMKEVSIGAEQSRKSLDLANKSAMSFGEAMKQAAYKFGIWSAITASYYKVIREISTGIKFVTEMDTALTEIGMVTNQTREQTAGLAKEYNNLAKEMKVLTSEVTSGAVEFYRQGLSQEEVMERLKVTTMYSKVANVDFKQSAELLTATVNSMGVSIERAADVFLFLGDATATSGEEIGKGFSKTSGAAAALGVEFEKVASWIAVISSKTRESAESIGHSINTMLTRFSRITETGFNEEDDTQLNDVAKALDTVGIALTDQQGNFRDFGTIMDEINSKWGKLDDQTKSYIANTVAGTRQQSRFFNLMNGYAESIELYSQSLEAAGTAQSKFGLYLESNQATLDNFRTTLEGLWLTVLDSDSLMSAVKAMTSFISVLDSMVQKFGTVGTVLNFLIPLMGVKLVWAIRSAYVEMVKLQATGSMSAFMPTSKILGQIVAQMLGLKVAAGGATVAVGGLTLATAGLTLGVGLLTLGIVKWAQKSREAKEAFSSALDNSQKLNDEVQSLENLAKKQEELTKIENKSVEQKEELIKVQRELAQLYPELATGIDIEGNKLADNLAMTKQLTEEKRKLLEQELLVIKTTADTKLPQLRQELSDMQDEADQIQKRLVSGDTTDIDYIEGYEIQIDKTQELKDRLLELVNTQKGHYEEITKLEDGVRSYSQILEENAERQRWATAEELNNQAAKAQTAQELEVVEKKLKDLGFTSEDTANIISGNIDLVKEKYKELDMQQIINLQTIENLDATQKQAMINMLESSRQATTQLIADTKARILAMQAEMKALSALTGGKIKNVNIMSAKGEIDPKSGILSSITTVAQNQSIDAQRELVKLEGNLADIEKALRNVSNIDTKQISGTRTPKDKKSKKEKEEYKAESNRYTKINLELERNNILLARNKTLQDLAGDDIAKKIKLMDEQIKLEKEQQSLSHQKANIARAERAELEKLLSKQGFKFSGEGDNRIIANLDHIQGKTKEVEEQFNRYKDIQSKEIPSLQQSWMNLSKSIKDVGLNIVKLEFDLADQSINELKKSLSDLEYSFKLLEDTDLESKSQNIANQILNLEQQVASANKELEELNAKQFKEGSEEAVLYANRIEELTKRIQDGTLAIKAQEEAITAMREKKRTDYIAEQNKLYEEQQQRLQALDAMQEKLVAIIRKRGEEEKKALDEAHRAEMDSLDKRHKERTQKYKDEIDAFNKMIQDKIKALDEQYEEEDYLEQLNKEREEANRLQKDIDVLSLDDSLTARNKTIELRKQLADQNEKIAKMQQKKERDLLKKSLQDQLKDKEQDAKDKEDIANNSYENEKKRLEEDYKINKEFLDKKYSDDRVYAEAKESIMRGQVEVAEGVFMDIYDAFEDFEDKFGKGMGILGDIIKKDFIDQLEKAQQAIRDMEYLSQNIRPKYDSDRDFTDDEIGWKEPDRGSGSSSNGRNPNYGVGVATGQTAKDNEQRLREDAAYRNSEIKRAEDVIRDRLSAGLDVKAQEAYLKRLISGRYKNGGTTERTGLHVLDGEVGKPERVLSQQQTKSFDKFVYSDMPKLQEILKSFKGVDFQDIIKNAVLSRVNITTPSMPDTIPAQQGDVYHIDKIFDISGTVAKDIMPLIRKEANGIEETLKNLNKGGIFRPAKM